MSFGRFGFAGVDLGGTNVRVAVDADEGGFQQQTERTASAGGSAVVDQIGRMIESVGVPIESCVVGLPGVVASHTAPLNLDYVFNIGNFTGVDVAGELGARLDASVYLENDLNLAAIGEWLALPEPRPNPFVFVGLGTGLGAGMIVDGRLLRGRRGAAGEIAHLPFGKVPRVGPPAPWLEELVSGRAVRRALRERLADSERTSLGPDASLEEIHAAADTDDVAAALVVDQAWNLSLGVAAIVAVIDPEAVVLGGSVGRSAATLRLCREMVGRLTPASVVVWASTLGDDGGLRGAVAVAREPQRWIETVTH